ncbi:Protein tpx2 [Rhizophlyctis rosea]|uniref:Protein tpx2 n=1 Tax=Rhizophlyctis rosea TaxID=64517 RepID=A0AAD5S537_9FUNG|nr:Protein tpx2 [Rhizophlyctis rosea]
MTARSRGQTPRASNTPRPYRQTAAIAALAKPILADPNENPFAPLSNQNTPRANPATTAITDDHTTAAASTFPVNYVNHPIPPLTASKDAAYEFNAPHFHDFLKADPDTSIDKWFDFQAVSPDSDDDDDDEDEYIAHNTNIFGSEFQNSKHEEQQPTPEDFPVNDVATPKASAFMKIRTADKVNMDEEDSDDEAPLNTPRPLAKRSLSTFTFNLPSQPSLRKSLAESSIRQATEIAINKPITFEKSAKPRFSTSSNHSIIGAKPFATRSLKPLTIPKEFNFSSRLAQRENALAMKRQGGGIQKKKGPTNKRRGLTVPKPFNLHANPKQYQKTNAPRSPYVPLAVRVKKFESTVPDRWRTRPAKPTQSRRFSEMKLTQAKSPYLRTKLRTKTHAVPTTEERLLQELENLQPFKAKPINTKILEKPVGVPKPPSHDLTIPQSPAITKPRPLPPPPPSPPKIVKANPVRNLPVFEPVLEHRVLLPEQVKLPGDEISEKKRREFEEAKKKLQEEAEKQRRFRAQPLPDDEPDPLPPVHERPITEPEPFHLETDIRHMMYQMSLEEKLEHERLEQQRAKLFKAQPLPHDEPFVPKRSEKPLTEIDEVVLFTEMRSEERRAFEEMLRQKEEMEQRERERMKREQEEREREEVRRLRQQQVHHAQPVKHYAPVAVKPSNRKLTEPESPMIGEKRRRAMEAARRGVGGLTGGVPSRLGREGSDGGSQASGSGEE